MEAYRLRELRGYSHLAPAVDLDLGETPSVPELPGQGKIVTPVYDFIQIWGKRGVAARIGHGQGLTTFHLDPQASFFSDPCDLRVIDWLIFLLREARVRRLLIVPEVRHRGGCDDADNTRGE